MKTFKIITLGCKVNQYESEALTQLFLANGYRLVSEEERASVCVINTCSVTNMSDRKSRKLIRRAVQESDVVAVMGCYAQAKPEEIAQIPGVDIVIGTGNKQKIFELAEKTLSEQTKKQTITIAPLNRDTSFDSVPIQAYSDKTRAILKIQDGCDSFCSYCIIPYVRGRQRSRLPQEILEEASVLAKNGYREIVLAGIHVCRYGLDFIHDLETDGISDLADLLLRLEKIDGIERIRLSSIEPLAFTEKFFSFYQNSKKLCPHFHISLQSGSDTVLKRMNRRYTGEFYKKTVARLREIRPETTVTTDVIVGFPGETDLEFDDTLSLIREVKFLKVHTFQYSRRSGTVADKMPDQIEPSLKEQRSKQVIEMSEKIEADVLESFVGKTLSVLAEEEKNGCFYGLSENYLPVLIETTEAVANEIYQVIPYRSDGKFLYAKRNA